MKVKVNGFLLFVTAVTAIAGFLYGYDTGIISGALIPIKDEFHLGHRMQEMVTSAILLGAILGALACGRAIERFGRVRTIAGLACVYTTGAILCAMAPGPLLLALARVFLGFAVGGSSQTIPVYVAELAPPKHRGHFVTTFNVAIGLGILAANLVATELHALVVVAVDDRGGLGPRRRAAGLLAGAAREPAMAGRPGQGGRGPRAARQGPRRRGGPRRRDPRDPRGRRQGGPRPLEGLARARPALGQAGGRRRARGGRVHPGHRHRDDGLLHADDADRRRVRPRLGDAGEPLAGAGLCGHDRPGPRRSSTGSAADASRSGCSPGRPSA